MLLSAVSDLEEATTDEDRGNVLLWWLRACALYRADPRWETARGIAGGWLDPTAPGALDASSEGV